MWVDPQNSNIFELRLTWLKVEAGAIPECCAESSDCGLIRALATSLPKSEDRSQPFGTYSSHDCPDEVGRMIDNVKRGSLV